MRTDRKWCLAVLVPLLAGCAHATAPMAMDDPGFGEANRQTMAAQIIDPVPPPETLAQNGSGDHVQAALERYRTDAVKRPDRMRTSTVASGGGGSGGSSSSK